MTKSTADKSDNWVEGEMRERTVEASEVVRRCLETSFSRS